MSRLEAFFTVPAATTVSATNSGGGPTSVSLTAGDYTPTLFVAHLVARLNAVRTPANWSGSLSSTTGRVTLNCTGTWGLEFTAAMVGTVIGFASNIGSGAVAVAGTQNARGLWLPDCTLTMQGDPISAPEVTDTRTVETPQGGTVTLGGTCKYVHRGLRWSHVARDRVMFGAETTVYASLQSWLRDTQWGRGHAWFTPGSKFQPYWSNGATHAIVGSDLNAGAGATYGWSCAPAISSLEQVTKRADESWIGMLSVEFSRITSEG